jgi:hypothetical protein
MPMDILTSSAVTGLPSDHLAFGWSFSVIDELSGAISQLAAMPGRAWLGSVRWFLTQPILIAL